MQRSYIAIDLKSFFASVECVARGLDPLTTNLVVADASRTEKTICLAVSPSLKAHGIAGRARLFEVVQRVREVNCARRQAAPGNSLRGSSVQAPELAADPSLALDYIIAPPQMTHYMAVSAQIYKIYLKYIAPEDIFAYSIDEVFIDATGYLKTYGLTPRELTMRMIADVLQSTGITATAGIGSNLYLCKVAMDIVAKHIPPDENGVRIAELEERSYCERLWDHRPLTDFWRVGRGYARRLEAAGIFTMGDIARRAIQDEEWFYRNFGVNAGLLIDHAWGVEPCTLADVRAYRPETNSLSMGQVLHEPYSCTQTRVIVREMTELLALELVERQLVTDQLVLTIGYDVGNLTDPIRAAAYRGEVTTDGYGRKLPKHAHGTANLHCQTASLRRMMEAMLELFDRIIDPSLLVRRVNLAANRIVPERGTLQSDGCLQYDIFSTPEEQERRAAAERESLAREKSRQEAIVAIRRRYGKNAILKGTNFREGATTRERNAQIGGHKA